MTERSKRLNRTCVAALCAAFAALSAAPAFAGPNPQDTRVQDRPAGDEVIYFLLPDRFANGDPANDRGGLEGDRLQTGYDPTDPGFYHGGDLRGLTGRL